MKLWDKGNSMDNKIMEFTVGNDRQLDELIAKYDVQASIAHAKMLTEVGLLTQKEGNLLVEELQNIGQKLAKDPSIESEFEDIHSKIESMLVEKLGDVGKKIHMSRSRNDQVAVAVNLYLKDQIAAIKDSIKNLFDQLMTLAEENQEVLMPGYTHLQIAMPCSFGLWFSSHAELLIDDIHLLNGVYNIIDQNPLGSGAGYGGSFPISRTSTTEKLEFKTLKYNSIAAQVSRKKSSIAVANAISCVAATLSNLSTDTCLFMSQNFGFLSLDEKLTTGSSIMPHKKNPDVFELIRGKCNVLQSLPTQITLLVNNLPMGYHRDFQLLKEGIFEGFETLKSCLDICLHALKGIKVNQGILDNPIYNYIFTVEDVNQKVLGGMPFRDAYKVIGQQVQEGTYKPSKTINHTHEGSIGNLCLKEIQEKMARALS